MHPLHSLVAATLLSSAPVPAPDPPRCGDPWIDRAVAEVAGRDPRGEGDHGECDLRLYGARWASYAELRAQVEAALSALRRAGLAYTPDGRGLRSGGEPVAEGRIYLGPAEGAPAGWERVGLPRGYVLAVQRS